MHEVEVTGAGSRFVCIFGCFCVMFYCGKCSFPGNWDRDSCVSCPVLCDLYSSIAFDGLLF